MKLKTFGIVLVIAAEFLLRSDACLGADVSCNAAARHSPSTQAQFTSGNADPGNAGAQNSRGQLTAVPLSIVQPTGRFYQYNAGIGIFIPVSNDKVSQGHVAVVIHGIFSDHNTMTRLGQFLACNEPPTAPQADFSLASVGGSPGATYTAVYCYEYNWRAHIDDSGRLFAQHIRNKFGSGPVVDIYAHSMGGLVSRWALEKEGLGKWIHGLVTLGTPHAGVPALPIQILNRLLGSLASTLWGPGVDDLGDTAVENPFAPSFLKRLNSGMSPYRNVADYYTIAGNDYAGYDQSGKPVGQFLHDHWYGNDIPFDGIVPQYSALAAGLITKSTAWGNWITHVVTVPLNHHEIADPNSDANLKTMASALRSLLLPTHIRWRQADDGEGAPAKDWYNGVVPLGEYRMHLSVGYSRGKGVLKSTRSINSTAYKVHIMQKMNNSDAVPNNFPVGYLSVVLADGSTQQQVLIAGQNTAEWAWEREAKSGHMPQHHLANNGLFSQWVADNSLPGGGFNIRHFYLSIDVRGYLGKPQSISRIVLEMNPDVHKYAPNFGIDIYAVTLETP